MSLGQILDKQLIDNLAIYIASREWKNAKELSTGIAKFRMSEDDDDDFVSSGWPVGKIHSEEHFKECCKKGKEKNKYYNISTGLLKKGGIPSYVYGEGWCVLKDSPEHIAIQKIVDIKNDNEFELDMTDSGWPILKDTLYIWDTDKNKVVGLLDEDEKTAKILKDVHINKLKAKNIPFTKMSLECIYKFQL